MPVSFVRVLKTFVENHLKENPFEKTQFKMAQNSSSGGSEGGSKGGSEGGSEGGSLEKDVGRLREEFDKMFNENKPSESSEKLKEYTFLAILGQGAFGLVVIYHSPFSLPLTFFSPNPTQTRFRNS